MITNCYNRLRGDLGVFEKRLVFLEIGESSNPKSREWIKKSYEEAINELHEETKIAKSKLKNKFLHAKGKDINEIQNKTIGVFKT